MRNRDLPADLHAMSKQATILFVAALVAAINIGQGAVAQAGGPAVETRLSAPRQDAAPGLYLYRAYLNAPGDVTWLTARFDAIEARGPDYLLIVGDASTAAALVKAGIRVEVDQTLDPTSPFSFYYGYRTVAEHYAHMDAIAAARPDLAVVVDYGDSWRKLTGAPNGHDLKAICITRRRAGDCQLSPDTDKPRFFLMAAIHARELTTSELAWRWMDYLVDNDGVDADVTALLTHNEMWIVPVANPDGRWIVEQGGLSPYTQRKNARTWDDLSCAYPPSEYGQTGIDLNRNAGFMWGGASTSSSRCSLVYRGPSASSEPEQQHIEQLMRDLFPDQRADDLAASAPATATGVMISLHSYSDLVLLPWGYVECYGAPCAPGQQAPNEAGLRSLAFRMSYFNGYQTGQASELLYAASGTTDDWAYGRLGVAAYTYEVGPASGGCGGFFPPYSCQDSRFWPQNRGAFLAAAKNARVPFATSLGPAVISPTVAITRVAPGAVVTLTAVVDDGLYSNRSGSVGRPSAQVITAAEVYVGAPPWLGGSPIAMAAADGAFDTARETVTAPIDTAGLCGGRNLVYVRGRDADGNWGPTTAQWLTLSGGCVYIPAVMRDAPASFE